MGADEMNEAHLRNCVGLFFLGPFMIWYSYRKGPPELARKVMFWSGVTVLSTSGLGYLNSRFGSGLGVGNLLPGLSAAPLNQKKVVSERSPPPPASPSPPPQEVRSTRAKAPVIDIRGEGSA